MNKMECETMIELIHKQLDGKLTIDEEKILKDHLSECSLCQQRLNSLEKIGILLKRERVKPPSDFTEKVLNRLPGEEPVFKPIRKPFIFPPQWKWVPALAILTIFLIISLILITKKPSPSIIMVTFTIEMPEAQAVSLVGDFNGWDVNACRLIRQDGIWAVKLPLPPGRYQYVFVADGEQWLPDPEAKDYVDNGYGSKNSVLDTTRL
ncbi:MAG: zf-HC2 domain-containing protein [bacterium]